MLLTPIRKLPYFSAALNKTTCRYCGRGCRNAVTRICGRCSYYKSGHTCSSCGNPICRQAKTGMCSQCAAEARQELLNPLPTPEQIISRAAEARRMTFRGTIPSIALDAPITGGHYAPTDDAERSYRDSRRTAATADLRDREWVLYEMGADNIGMLLASGIEECFMPAPAQS